MVGAKPVQHDLAQMREGGRGAVVLARRVHRKDLRDPSRPRLHDDDPVTEKDRLLDVMGDKNGRDALATDDPPQFSLSTPE